jgi:hypothetical protein
LDRGVHIHNEKIRNLHGTKIPGEFYICKSVENDLKHGNFICTSEENYLTYEHRIEIPVEFTYVKKKKMI